MLDRTVEHLIHNVLPAAAEYEAAERALSEAFAQDAPPKHWEEAARTAKRKAAELAVAIDGLSDRAHVELGESLNVIRATVSGLCIWPTSGNARTGCLERVRGAANAYKHADLADPRLPITSDNDVLVVGLGYGLDGYGVGKMGDVEVIIKETGGTSYKFLGDMPIAIRSWFSFLQARGATLPTGPYTVVGIQVYP